MKLFDKIKNGLVGFSQMLSSVDVPNIDDPKEELSNELKEQLAFADGLACKTTDMVKQPKKEKTFIAGFNKQASIKEKSERSIDKEKEQEDISKEEKEH